VVEVTDEETAYTEFYLRYPGHLHRDGYRKELQDPSYRRGNSRGARDFSGIIGSRLVFNSFRHQSGADGGMYEYRTGKNV